MYQEEIKAIIHNSEETEVSIGDESPYHSILSTLWNLGYSIPWATLFKLEEEVW